MIFSNSPEIISHLFRLFRSSFSLRFSSTVRNALVVSSSCALHRPGQPCQRAYLFETLCALVCLSVLNSFSRRLVVVCVAPSSFVSSDRVLIIHIRYRRSHTTSRDTRQRYVQHCHSGFGSKFAHSWATVRFTSKQRIPRWIHR
jgi:hypothetical protein